MVLNPGNVEIISIGDEILYGHIQDTNASWLSDTLSQAGFTVIHRTTIGDQHAAILDALASAEARASVIIVTGGLGPTDDDLTKPCFCTYFQCPLVLNEEALEAISNRYAKRGLPLNDLVRSQAYLPQVAKKLSNHLGTAPGMWFDKGDKTFIALPGVPHEMKALMEATLPDLINKHQPSHLLHRVIRTVGCGETILATAIAEYVKTLPSFIRLAYLPGPGEVKLRLSGIGNDKALLTETLDNIVKQMLPLIEPYVYSLENIDLPTLIGKLLKQSSKTLAVAESCTGGFLGHLISQIPGASDYFWGGIIAYDNHVKMALLNVSNACLEQHGAVSEETAKAMAVGVKAHCQTDFGISVTGVAGPTGGTREKPVGTVWIGICDAMGVSAQKFVLGNDRQSNIQWASLLALNALRKKLII